MMGGETGVAQTESKSLLTVNVRKAVAIVAGASDATFSTVTAAKMKEQCAVPKVTNLKLLPYVVRNKSYSCTDI